MSLSEHYEKMSDLKRCMSKCYKETQSNDKYHMVKPNHYCLKHYHMNVQTTVELCSEMTSLEPKCQGGEGYFFHKIPNQHCYCCTESKSTEEVIEKIGHNMYKLDFFTIQVLDDIEKCSEINCKGYRGKQNRTRSGK